MKYVIETQEGNKTLKVFSPTSGSGGLPYFKMVPEGADGIGREHVRLVVYNADDPRANGHSIGQAHIPGDFTLVRKTKGYAPEGYELVKKTRKPWKRIDEDAPYQVDVELWSHRNGKCVGRMDVVGWNGASFDRAWITTEGDKIEPTWWRELEPPA